VRLAGPSGWTDDARRPGRWAVQASRRQRRAAVLVTPEHRRTLAWSHLESSVADRASGTHINRRPRAHPHTARPSWGCCLSSPRLARTPRDVRGINCVHSWPGHEVSKSVTWSVSSQGNPCGELWPSLGGYLLARVSESGPRTSTKSTPSPVTRLMLQPWARRTCAAGVEFRCSENKQAAHLERACPFSSTNNYGSI
jgi:hypothetical protein